MDFFPKKSRSSNDLNLGQTRWTRCYDYSIETDACPTSGTVLDDPSTWGRVVVVGVPRQRGKQPLFVCTGTLAQGTEPLVTTDLVRGVDHGHPVPETAPTPVGVPVRHLVPVRV